MKSYLKLVVAAGITAILLVGFGQIVEAASKKDATPSVEKIKKTNPLSSQQPSSQKKKKQKTKPSPITKPLNLQPVKGYCCAQGTFYSRITRAECQRKKGHYSSNKESIKSNCGWCCKDGKVRSVSSAEEKKKRCATGAKLHKTEGLADRNCGWCCKTKGIVVASLRSECDVKKFHQEKSEAEKQCKPPSGYCNVRGKTLKRISPERCKRLGGTFYKRFALANRDLLTLIRQEALNETRDTRDTRDDNKQEPLIWCCDDGEVSRITKEECVGTEKKPLNGKVFTTQRGALRACRNLGLTRAQRFERFNPAGVKPALLPDLEIVKTSTNRQCFMTVRVKNNGGPISSSNHGTSTIHLSAGPGSISSKTQLTDIDPGGVLKSAGGEITATTELRITKASQATLTWVDTNHQIVESNETNNGDDAVLSCKTPLIWCCLIKQPGMIGGGNLVGQMTLGECNKVGGNPYKTEGGANKACGIKSTPMLGKVGFQVDKKVDQKEGVFKKKGPSKDTQRMELNRDIRAERMLPRLSETRVEGQTWPGSSFPARITSTNCPKAVGSGLSIYGHDFGSEGRVLLAPGPGGSFPCEVTEWSEDRIRCIIPISMADSIGQSAKDVVVSVLPARAERPDPGEIRAPGSSSGPTYYWSGDEGPQTTCSVQPFVPDIDSLSRSELSPMQELTIHGDNFGESRGEVGFNVPGESHGYVTEVLDWSNESIRIRLMDTTTDSYGDSTDTLFRGESRAAQVEVTNSADNSDSADITFVPGGEGEYPDVDLFVNRVHITRRTVAGQRQLLINVWVGNRGRGDTSRRIRVDIPELGKAAWLDGGIGGKTHSEPVVRLIGFIYNDSHRGDDLDFRVLVDRHDDIPESGSETNECHVTWRGSDMDREYSCITL